jgi:hypothetical protein
VAKDVKKADWPRLPNGTVDWETVFEAPKNGLIELIEEANKPQTVIDCTAMIIQSLFARDSDEVMRGKFTQKLVNISTTNADDLPKTISETVTVLRGIKEDRIARAADWAAHSVRRSSENERAERDERLAEERKLRANDVDFIFTDVFCDILDRKLQVMWSGVDPNALIDRAPPFIVSSEFALIFEGIVRESLMPQMVASCRYIISEASRLPADKRRNYLEERLGSSKTRKEVWNIWQSVWNNFMEEADYPPKPEEDKAGLFGSIKRIVKDNVADEGEYTIDDWHHDVEIINEQNAEIRAVTAKLLAPADSYVAPRQEDLQMLMKVFAINEGEIRKYVSALLQIAEDKEKAAPDYDRFQRGKQLEMPLIAACYQHPDIFIQGKRPMLPYLFRGARPQQLKQNAPYVVHELADVLSKPAKI